MINYLVFFFFHFQKKYKPTPVRAYIPMNIYIGFTLSPKRYAMRRLVAVLNYFSSFTNDAMITFLTLPNAMVSLALFPESISIIVPSPKTLCLTLSPRAKFAIYLCFPLTKESPSNQHGIYNNDDYNNAHNTFFIYFSSYIPKQLEWRI